MQVVWRTFVALLAIFPLISASQDANQLLLKDFHPFSIYNVPKTNISAAKFRLIDMHSHDYVASESEIQNWIRNMDSANIQETMILSYRSGRAFDSVVEKYSKYKDRFLVWCGFDYTGIGSPGWIDRAVSELVRCHAKGAIGVGELGDKGLGEVYSKPTPGYGVHVDDPRLRPLFRKCAELHMPVSIHVAEDEWMYLEPDSLNDGLMNSAIWHVNMKDKGRLNHQELINTLENVVRQNPSTIFIACHLANCCADLSILGSLLDKYPNLYADIAARYGEIAPIPRFVKSFFEKYSDRLVYGTDMGISNVMYRMTFRILESNDEHFYEGRYLYYHWPLYGLGLSESTLKKIYRDNALRILRQ